MAELRQRHPRGGARRNRAYQRSGCGHYCEGRIEQREAKLWAQLMEEWGSYELRRARRSVATAMALRKLSGCAEVKEKARKAKWEAQGSVGECCG